MIPANKTTIPEAAYSLAIEAAEGFARRYHRLAFWVPFYGREFQIKAKMWDYTVERLRNHAQYLGSGAKSRKPTPEIVDIRIPPRAAMADNVGFGE